jgi:hypothetical protein
MTTSIVIFNLGLLGALLGALLGDLDWLTDSFQLGFRAVPVPYGNSVVGHPQLYNSH